MFFVLILAQLNATAGAPSPDQIAVAPLPNSSTLLADDAGSSLKQGMRDISDTLVLKTLSGKVEYKTFSSLYGTSQEIPNGRFSTSIDIPGRHSSPDQRGWFVKSWQIEYVSPEENFLIDDPKDPTKLCHVVEQQGKTRERYI